MRLIQLVAVPLAIAICVSVTHAQETETKLDNKVLAKASKMLHGMWVGDGEKTAEEIEKLEDLPLEDAMIDMLLERVKSIKASFKDGTFEVEVGERKMAGAWKVTKIERKDDARVLTVNFAPDEESEAEEKNFELHFKGKKHMKMIDLGEDGPPIVLKRKATDKKEEKSSQ